MPTLDSAQQEAPSQRRRAPQPNQGAATQNFTKYVESTVEALVAPDDTQVDDIRRVLLQVRQEYDSVHHEAEQKDARLKSLRDSINAAERMNGHKAEELVHLEEKLKSFDKQYRETVKQKKDTQTSRKVYEHMLARIQKEQAILKQKMLKMEEHVARKRRDVRRRVGDSHRIGAERKANERALEALEDDKDMEKAMCHAAREVMRGEVKRLETFNQQKAEFESWRHDVALQAANEAFNASAGRLRKLYAIEKLCGNCLQKITFEQVERSQNTEDGFQKIREVTGLTDVMDIVHKFLNRDVEQEQLRSSVKDAEVRLEALRQDFDAFKRDTEGITFNHRSDSDGGIYKEIEQSEHSLNEQMQEHEGSRVKLQKTTLQIEHMKRWAARTGQLLSSYEEPVRVEAPPDLGAFFRRLEGTIQRFVEGVEQQIAQKKIHKKALQKENDKEVERQKADLESQEFLKINCRVPLDKDNRSTSRQGAADDEPTTSFEEDREFRKKESADRRAQADQPKRGKPKGQ